MPTTFVRRLISPLGRSIGLVEAIRAQVYTLPGDTVLYPGHGPETTVAEEKANNPYVTA